MLSWKVTTAVAPAGLSTRQVPALRRTAPQPRRWMAAAAVRGGQQRNDDKEAKNYNVAGVVATVVQVAVAALLSGIAYFANDTLSDVRGDLKELRGQLEKTNSKVEAKIDVTNSKIDAKFDALIQQQLLDRVTRLENDRFSPSKGR